MEAHVNKPDPRSAPASHDTPSGEPPPARADIDIRGGCHCGNIDYRLAWPSQTDPIVPRACSCTYCRKHGACWIAHPQAALIVQVSDSARVSRYRHGTRTAEFQACAECGVVVLASCDIDGRTHAVVNANTIDAPLPPLGDRVAVSFDGEDRDSRLARRVRVWIPEVSFQCR